MSLTSHLRDPGSPIGRWFAANLPGTRSVVGAANRELRAGRASCLIPRPAGGRAQAVCGARAETAERYQAAAWEKMTIDDLRALGPAILADYEQLGARRPAYLKPTFVSSVLFGGADADAIVNGMLIDFKSTTSPRIAGR